MNKITGLMLFLAFLLVGCGSSDIDMDNIPNKVDECPNEAEDMDGFEDTDGCPEWDNDKDGVEDKLDKCVHIPEDRDGFEDEDGCPDKDNDADGIPDTKDNCPMEPEDKDGFEDMDGCPELDNDKDGVPDDKDKCILDPEDVDGFEDEDGCPDYDNDKDGIRDQFDKCPLEPEQFNGKDDDDGCPDVEAEPLPESFELPIRFTTGTAELTFESVVMLEEKIVKKLKVYPDHKVFIFVFMPKIEMEIEEYLKVLNERSNVIADMLETKGVNRSQIRIRTVDEEMYNSKVGTADDFNQDRQVMFKRK